LNRKISIVGLGYVGLPLAILAAKSGFEVIGVDSNLATVQRLNNGVSAVEGILNEDLRKLVVGKKLLVTSDFSKIKHADIIIICVPTPLSKSGKPDLSFLEGAVVSVAQHLSQSSLVIIESTVAPGNTRNIIMPLIKRNLTSQEIKIYLSFSPERIDPLNIRWNLKNTPKLVAGLDDNSKIRAVEFYSRFIDNIVECETLEIAETAKLLENSYRLINISFINELSLYCHKFNIDIEKVIRAASTKPYGFMPFFPSLGIGGHCIPVDPIYLMESANDLESPIESINVAIKINKKLPHYFIEIVKNKFGPIEGKKIIIIGVSYKSNVADVRETPVEALILGLRKQGATVSWHDDLVKNWLGEKSTGLSNEFDLAILATHHDGVDLMKLGNVPVLNTKRL